MKFSLCSSADLQCLGSHAKGWGLAIWGKKLIFVIYALHISAIPIWIHLNFKWQYLMILSCVQHCINPCFLVSNLWILYICKTMRLWLNTIMNYLFELVLTSLCQDVMILDQSMLFGVADIHDRHRDMRLDVDNMSYEVIWYKSINRQVLSHQ